MELETPSAQPDIEESNLRHIETEEEFEIDRVGKPFSSSKAIADAFSLPFIVTDIQHESVTENDQSGHRKARQRLTCVARQPRECPLPNLEAYRAKGRQLVAEREENGCT